MQHKTKAKQRESALREVFLIQRAFGADERNFVFSLAFPPRNRASLR